MSRRVTRRSFTLRDLRRSDREAMYRLDHRCFEPGIAFTRAQIETFLGLESLEGVVAETRGKLVGFAIGYLRRPALGGVLTLDVDPDHRRGGVGRALFTELLARLERAGTTAVRLEVDARNASAIAFYRSFGLRKLGRIADYYGDGKDAFEMERGASSPAPRRSRSTARASSSETPPSRRA
ncbi:MAG: GNAT family N-acetyltransferase [Thermoanaerobaculia bacterium]